MATAQAPAAKPSARNAAFLPVAQRSGGQSVAAPAAEALAALHPQDTGPGTDDEPSHKLSNRQWEQLLRQNFINIRPVREWRDIHSQLPTVGNEHKWKINTEPAGYDAVHLSMLSGLLRSEEHTSELQSPCN